MGWKAFVNIFKNTNKKFKLLTSPYLLTPWLTRPQKTPGTRRDPRKRISLDPQGIFATIL
jgi:hypothetical protein